MAHTAETKKKISETKTGVKQSTDTVQKRKETWKKKLQAKLARKEGVTK